MGCTWGDPAATGADSEDTAAGSPTLRSLKQFSRALLIGGTVSAGFVVLFGVVGGLIGVGASFIGDLLPWLGLIIGIGLVVAGAWLVGGGNIYRYTGFAARAADNIGGVNHVSVRGYFMFGLSYGAASLGCTLPVFLAVVGISVAGSSIASVVSNFFLFALGMGIVIMALTLGIAFFKGTMVGFVRKALPYVTPFGSWLNGAGGHISRLLLAHRRRPAVNQRRDQMKLLLLAGLMLAIMVLSLAACGGDDAAPTEGATSQPQTATAAPTGSGAAPSAGQPTSQPATESPAATGQGTASATAAATGGSATATATSAPATAATDTAAPRTSGPAPMVEPDPDYEDALDSAEFRTGGWKTDFSLHTVSL